MFFYSRFGSVGSRFFIYLCLHTESFISSVGRTYDWLCSECRNLIYGRFLGFLCVFCARDWVFIYWSLFDPGSEFLSLLSFYLMLYVISGCVIKIRTYISRPLVIQHS